MFNVVRRETLNLNHITAICQFNQIKRRTEEAKRQTEWSEKFQCPKTPVNVLKWMMHQESVKGVEHNDCKRYAEEKALLLRYEECVCISYIETKWSNNFHTFNPRIVLEHGSCS